MNRTFLAALAALPLLGPVRLDTNHEKIDAETDPFPYDLVILSIEGPTFSESIRWALDNPPPPPPPDWTYLPYPDELEPAVPPIDMVTIATPEHLTTRWPGHQTITGRIRGETVANFVRRHAQQVGAMVAVR